MSDENMHPVGSEPAWSESYYFNFVDPESKIGMFTRMGFRPGSGWADALHVVYLPGKRVLFTYGRREIKPDLTRYDQDLQAGHLQLECVSPHKHWRIHYDGAAQDIDDPSILLTRSKERPVGWYTPAHLRMNLDFNCITEPHYAAAGAKGHFEQSGQVSGEIRLDDHTWTVHGYGVRDKSWGPRDWGAGLHRSPTEKTSSQGPSPFVNWFSLNFGADVAMGGACAVDTDGVMRGTGWMQNEGQSTDLKEVEISTDYENNSILHRAIQMNVTTQDGQQIALSGEVLNVCPTKIAMPGGATFVNEGLTQFTWGERVGYGIAEHWHAIRL